jgi:hypothetical protein
MAILIAFDCFALNMGQKIHNLSTDVLKMYLSDVAPAPGNTVFGTPAEIAAVGGYTAGGLSLGANTWSQFGGLASLTPGNNLTFVATTGFGPFRYGVLYNFTAAAQNLIGYVDAGSEVTLTPTQSFAFAWPTTVLTNHF